MGSVPFSSVLASWLQGRFRGGWISKGRRAGNESHAAGIFQRYSAAGAHHGGCWRRDYSHGGEAWYFRGDVRYRVNRYAASGGRDYCFPLAN